MSATSHSSFEEFLSELRRQLQEIRAVQGKLPSASRTEPQAAFKHSKSKIITFLRHGQGNHNVAELEPGFSWEAPGLQDARPDLVDPKLTPKGCAEAQAVSDWSAANLYDAEAVFVSPMRRTLETATIGMQPLKGRVPWTACEDLREVCQKHICDLRQRLSETTKSSEFAHVDFAAVADDDVIYNCNDGAGETLVDVANRALRFIRWLFQCPHTRIVVVTHSCFLFVLFNVVLDCGDGSDLKSFFSTCEHRTVEIFADWENCVNTFVSQSPGISARSPSMKMRFAAQIVSSIVRKSSSS